tara:strand:+ start:666 stop:947 length:282 start_codon:yes stop_codon:yes gene_type:complete
MKNIYCCGVNYLRDSNEIMYELERVNKKIKKIKDLEYKMLYVRKNSEIVRQQRKKWYAKKGVEYNRAYCRKKKRIKRYSGGSIPPYPRHKSHN